MFVVHRSEKPASAETGSKVLSLLQTSTFTKTNTRDYFLRSRIGSHCSPVRARRRLSSPDVSTATWSRWRCYCRGEYKQMKKKKKKKKCLFLCRRSSLSERHQPCCDYHTKKNTRTRAWSTGADKKPCSRPLCSVSLIRQQFIKESNHKVWGAKN